MSRDRSKLPSVRSSGPPDLLDKKTKDWKKMVWKTDQAKVTQPLDLLICVDVVNTYGQNDLLMKYSRLFFEESNNQLFISTTSWKVTGPKKSLIKFLTGDLIKMKEESVISAYPELK